MAMQVKDAGEREGRAVMAWIGVERCSDPKGCRLPAGVTGREPLAHLHTGHVYNG